MKHIRWYRCVWKVLRVLTGPIVRHKCRFKGEKCGIKGPILLISNHNTDYDPIILGSVFPEYMSFVASEHVFRMGFASRLINLLTAPIARFKGGAAADTVFTILKRLKKGVSVALFAEGNRSFDGKTGEILPATGQLAKLCGATLVTYRLHGGYLTSPRWSGSKMRKGKMTGEIAGVYPPEELKKMSPDEISEIIKRDIFVDAYADQEKETIKYRCKRPAEHIETLFCLCPSCKKIGSLSSEKNVLSCACGFHAELDEYGYFSGEGIPAKDITSWDAFQTKALYEILDNADDGVLFSDDDMVFYEVLEKHKTGEKRKGKITLYKDRLDICGSVFPIGKIGGFSVCGPQRVDMSACEKKYEIISGKPKCTRKYMLALSRLKEISAKTEA